MKRKEKTDRSGADALCDRCLLFFLCVRFFQFFSDQIKRSRPDIQNKLMKPFLGKIFAPADHGLFFQFQKFQIAEIIFCVVGRIPQNQLIDFRNAVFVTDTVLEEESKRVFFPTQPFSWIPISARA